MYEGQERRKHWTLSEEQFEAIAERAADKALEKVYNQVGKSVLTRLAWLAGIVIISLALWLSGAHLLVKLP